MLNTVTAVIETATLRRNLAAIRALCRDSRIVAMVKADGYGHGIVESARAFADADAYGVARLAEAMTLRASGLKKRILLMATALGSDDLRWCSSEDVDVVVHDGSSLGAVLDVAPSAPLKVWLELDSGMHRLGLTENEFVAADRRLRGAPGIREIVHMTHFAGADERDPASLEAQRDAFERCHAAHPATPQCIANSAALLRRPELRRDWVRPGIALYGCPSWPAAELPLTPAMTLSTRVVAIRSVAPGDAVGYAGTWIAQRPSVIATLGIGYGDGYPRHAPTGTPVLIHGRCAPLCGRVSMDSLAVDVTDIGDVAVGTEAVLWGRDLSAEVIAGHANTIAYHLFAALTARVDRHYR